MSIRAIVFDFDGVLANSEPLHFQALRELLAGRGIALDESDYYARYVGYDDVGVFELLGEEHGWTMGAGTIPGLVEEKSRIFDALIASTDVLFPTALACIDRLAAVYPLGIASGALKHEIVSILRRHDIEDRFKFIVASGDTPQSKPAPDPYRRAAELHGLPPAACLAIEDSKWGIESARAAGLRCIGITTTYAADALDNAEQVIASLDEFTPALIASL